MVERRYLDIHELLNTTGITKFDFDGQPREPFYEPSLSPAMRKNLGLPQRCEDQGMCSTNCVL